MHVVATVENLHRTDSHWLAVVSVQFSDDSNGSTVRFLE
jgi:hypothetical protein